MSNTDREVKAKALDKRVAEVWGELRKFYAIDHLSLTFKYVSAYDTKGYATTELSDAMVYGSCGICGEAENSRTNLTAGEHDR